MLVRLQCMALDTSANLSQASARSILPARVLATRVPEVGTAREDRIRAAQLRQLPCLKPDAQVQNHLLPCCPCRNMTGRALFT